MVKGNVSFSSLRTGSTISTVVETFYDEWATNYDKDLEKWGYRAPKYAAALLNSHLLANANVLDVGCGTGRFAEALLAHKPSVVTGIDISQPSLKLADCRRVYARLQRCDLQELPLPFHDNGFDAAASVGVLAYIAHPGEFLTELCRIICPKGYILFTHRDDRWQESHFDKLLESIEEQGLWTILDISEAKPYLPRNKDFANNIKVIYVLCCVL